MPTEVDNKVQFGLSNVYIAALASDGTYSTPVHIAGAVELSTSPEGDSKNFYADNIPYFTAVTNAGYTGDLTLALLPDTVKVTMGLGTIDSNGAFYENADTVPQPFALLFEVKGDSKNRRNIFYHVTASRPESDDKTIEDSTDPTTEKVSVTMIPEEMTISAASVNVTKLSIPKTIANTAVYESFFTAVVKPNASVA